MDDELFINAWISEILLGLKSILQTWKKPERGKEPIQRGFPPSATWNTRASRHNLRRRRGSHLDDSVVVCSSLHLVFPSPLNLFLTEGSSDMSSYASLKIVGSVVTHVWNMYLNMCHSK